MPDIALLDLYKPSESLQLRYVSTIIISIWQMKKARYREVKQNCNKKFGNNTKN